MKASCCSWLDKDYSKEDSYRRKPKEIFSILMVSKLFSH